MSVTASDLTAPPKIFLTGDPGCGKTTLIRRIVERLDTSGVRGFVTEEVREDGRRAGFRGVTLDGRSFVLARLGGSGDYQVGPYGVVLEGLDTVGVEALTPAPDTRLVVVDEVGKMEAFSAPFREAVERLLSGPVAILGTVALHGVGFPKRVRQDPRVELIRVTRRSREAMAGEVVRRLAEHGLVKG